MDSRNLFAAAPAPMLVVAPNSPQFTITDVNDAYLASVNRVRADLVGFGLFSPISTVVASCGFPILTDIAPPTCADG